MSKITAYAALTAALSDDVLPIVDVHDTSMASSGTTKKIAVSDLGTAVISNAWQYLLLEPSGTLAVTMPRNQASGALTIATGTVYCSAIPLSKGVTVTNIVMMPSTAAETGGSHCWAALLDPTLTVLAVSADNTGATFFTNTAEHSLAMGSPYTTTAAGLFYCAFSCTATGMPNLTGASYITSTVAIGSVGGSVLYGTAGTQNAPPAVSAQLNAGSLTAATAAAFRARVT